MENCDFFFILFGLTASHRSHLANILFLPRAFTVEKREENVLSGDEVGTLRSIVVTLLDYDASGTEQLFCTCITIFL